LADPFDWTLYRQVRSARSDLHFLRSCFQLRMERASSAFRFNYQELQMNSARRISIFSAVAATTMTMSAWAASNAQHDSHHPATTATIQVAQASAATPGMGMGGMAAMPGSADQMKAMQVMHDKMMTAKTPQERNALMTEQMKLMHDGMGMMGRMGSGAMAGKPGDMASRQGMMEQRMDMMQSMMQMMMDRMAPAPATK
jgi:hypothetical protein